MDVRPAPGTGGGAEVPTCFRHPERETYLSCVRCGRPACPECLRSAPVGQQCVECIKEGNRGVRRPAAIFGGRAGRYRHLVANPRPAMMKANPIARFQGPRAGSGRFWLVM